MSLLAKLKKKLKNPWTIADSLARRGYFDRMSDQMYLKIVYRARMGEKLNLKNPVSFNQKLQWLKLHDRRGEYPAMVDKQLAKEYVSGRIGAEYIIPTLGVWNSFDEIDFDALPDRFVLKCTHDSGGLAICRDKNSFDRAAVREKIERSLRRNFYLHGREWPYKEIKPRIIAEEYMENSDGSDLSDYKLHCFNGKMKLVLVCRDRYSDDGLTEDFFSETWEHLPIRRPTIPNSKREIPCPETFQKMIALAEELSAGIPFLRVDFYEISGRIYFGELTFFPASGMSRFVPDEWDNIIGGWINLPKT